MRGCEPSYRERTEDAASHAESRDAGLVTMQLSSSAKVGGCL